MDNQKKHYLITSLTLGIIAAASAGIIGLTNMITRDQISRNEENKIKSGIAEIFGENVTPSEEKKLTGEYKYVQYYYDVNKDQVTSGYAFRTTGSNMYGKISLMVGFTSESKFQGLSIVINEQTYASTLVENYIDPLNEGKRALEDVSCGATYGAKLVRDMVNEATTALGEIING